jgi:8-oxo-dGTP pyrophosphatase MutT (NUDIX family)
VSAVPPDGADALIVDGSGRVLLVQRADDRLWAMPGGWVDDGETPSAAAVRETLEETGLVVEVTSLAGVAARPASRHFTFRCDVLGGTLRASEESLDVRFWDVNEVPGWHADHRVRVMSGVRVRDDTSARTDQGDRVQVAPHPRGHVAERE